MTSQSVLKGCQIFCLNNFLWQIIPLIDYANKKGMFKTAVFKVADEELSLKQ